MKKKVYKKRRLTRMFSGIVAFLLAMSLVACSASTPPVATPTPSEPPASTAEEGQPAVSKPAETTKPSETQKPVEQKPTEVQKPAEQPQETQAPEPTETTPVETTKPESEKPAETEAPAEFTKPSEQPKPTETQKPEEQKPAETQTPAETTKPTEQPQETQTPEPTETTPIETPKPEQPASVAGMRPETSAPGMAAYGLVPNAQVGVGYPYTTLCEDDRSVSVTGTLTFTNYSRVDDGDGYEKITVKISVNYTDPNAINLGTHALCSIADYYLYEEYGDDASLRDGYHSTYSMTIGGKTYDACGTGYNYSYDKTSTYVTSYVTYTIRIPKGYDGIVVWYGRYPGEDGYSIHLNDVENLIMFRCQ